jgi:peptidoglycan hydrolase-like protein with peptidoglycan-binding domain
MQNKKLLKILGLVAAFLLIVFSWVVIRDAQKKKILNTPTPTGIENPFGSSGSDNELPNAGAGSASNVDTGVGNNPPVTGVQTGVIVVEDNPALRQLATSSVAGFVFRNEERDIPESISATPAASVVEVYDFSGYKTIRFGDKADEVVAIKTVLNRQTPSPGLIVDNNYDTDMKNAVVDFQNRSGLSGDGVIGAKTYAKFNSFQGLTTFTEAKKPKNTETVPMVRYVDSASGILYDVALRKKEETRKITELSVPRVVEAYFDSTRNNVVMRYLKDGVIQTYLAKLTFAKIDPALTQAEKDAITKIAEVSGEFLPEGIETVSLSRDKKSLFYMNPIAGGVAGITYNFSNKVKKQVFDSPLREWIADWNAESKINLTTKAASVALGYSFAVDTKTGSSYKTLGGTNGLTTLMSPDGKKILYAEAVTNGINTFVVDLATGKNTSISPSAMPEKCVWTRDSKAIYCAAPIKSVAFSYPDDWYKGKISFSDALWMIDATDYVGNIEYDFKSKNGVEVDAMNLQLRDEEDYIGFINKKDGSLWGLDLSR